MSENQLAELGFSDNLVEALRENGYESFTEIQKQAIPQAMMGRDVLAVAQTGSGKTAAFTLPTMEQLQGKVSRARMPRCLILEPTRELALQVQEYFEKFTKHVPMNISLLIGGVTLNNQERNALNACDVLIATPGRLLDHMDRGTIMLGDTKHFIIDEADRMLDMGFIPDIRKIALSLPRIRQTLLFSATMPKDIKKLADDFMINPKEISVSPSGTISTNITQYIVKCRDKQGKYKALVKLLDALEKRAEDEDTNGTGIIFCNKKRDVKILNDGLHKRDFNVDALHGDMHQHLRMECLNRFKEGKVKILVCSDVAARGLDIAAVDFVINFDLPDFSEDYVHRIGRTGRAGRKGSSYSLVEAQEKKYLDSIEKLIRSKLTPYKFADDYYEEDDRDDRRDDRQDNRRDNRQDDRYQDDRYDRDDRRDERSDDRRDDRNDRRDSRPRKSKSHRNNNRDNRKPSRNNRDRDYDRDNNKDNNRDSPRESRNRDNYRIEEVKESSFNDAESVPAFLQKPTKL